MQLRIYLLKGDARLRNATFEDIWQNDASVLQGDLVKMDQHTLFPGDTKRVPVQPSAEARYVAAVALFGEPQGKDWFVSYELEPPRSAPPCPKSGSIPIWLDRMQIQDGQGRAEEAAAADRSPSDVSSTGGTRD